MAGPTPDDGKQGCSLASRGLSLPGQKHSCVRGKSGLRSLQAQCLQLAVSVPGPRESLQEAVAPTSGLPPAQQRSTMGKRGALSLRPALPRVARARPRPRRGGRRDLEEGGRKKAPYPAGSGTGRAELRHKPAAWAAGRCSQYPVQRPRRRARPSATRKEDRGPEAGRGLATGRGLAKGGARAGLAAARLPW